MPIEKKTLKLTLTGGKEVVDKMEKLLSHVSWCCNVGHSANIQFWIDGDGPDSLSIKGIDKDKLKKYAEMSNALSSWGDLEKINDVSAWSGDTLVWSEDIGDIVKETGLYISQIENEEDFIKLEKKYTDGLSEPEIKSGKYSKTYIWKTPDGGICQIEVNNENPTWSKKITNEEFRKYWIGIR